MPDGLRLALTTLTVARLRRPVPPDRRTAGRAMELAPFVGLLLGLAAAAVLYGTRLLQDAGGTALLPCVLAVGTLAVLTRGLHLDGLADLTDGLASYQDPEGARAVMKAPDVGPLGVVSLVLVLLVQASALLACVQEGRGVTSLLLSVATGRLAMTAACRGTPAATAVGMGALVAGTVRRGVTAAWFVVLAAAFALVGPDATGATAEQVARVLLALSLALLMARLLRAHAVRRLGGLTGDVLGALCEGATAVSLVVLSAGWS